MKLARRTYVAGSVGFLLIGVLHTAVHLAELSGASLEAQFRQLGAIELNGRATASWDLFQGTSLLMGFFSVAVGLVDLGALQAVGRRSLPPPLVAMANIAMLSGIVAIGMAHLGPLQIYGGLLGIALFTVGIVANVRSGQPAVAAAAP